MQKKLFLMIALMCTMVQGAWAQTEVSTESALTSAISGGTTVSVKLTEDITLSNYVDIPANKTVTLDLNGKTLNRGLSALTDYGIVIRVETGGTLTVKDSGTGGTITGGYDATGGGICVLGTLNFQGGTISGCNGTKGGAIYVVYGGTVNMTGGTIDGCSASDCGGIYNNGTLTISGGTIQNCTSGQGGGGVVNYGAAYINGGTITGNTATTRGGGVWNDEDASLTVTGGTITSNTAGTNGGGLFSKSHIIMRGNPVITGNTVGSSANNLYLVGDRQIICDGGDFTTGASIGVTLENYGRKFTKLYSFNNGSTDPATYFTMDNSSYAVATVDNEAFAGAVYVERSWEGSNTGGHVKSETKTCISYSTISTTELTDDGWYLLSGENVFNDRIIISADVKFILADGSNAEFKKGIRSGAGSKLTIYGQGGGTGKICATGSGDAENAAIGADENTMGGTLIIHGGTIEASSSENNAAGIGGGDGSSMQSITIYGGTVTATGKSSGAGIGGGQENNKVSDITIYGGTVTATGGEYSAGIGTGEEGTAGAITIYGGTIKATGGHKGAGIGTGEDATAGTITIYGGDITAEGGEEYGAGIGSGYETDNGTIIIYGGTVNANGGYYGSGIGGGNGGSGGTVTIYGGDVTATAGKYGIGIGGTSSATVNIYGGTVKAHGKSYNSEGGAGIGVKDGTLNCHITDGDVTADILEWGSSSDDSSSACGAGIGGYNSHNTTLYITIDGGTVNATGAHGGAGIGSGSYDSAGGGDIKSGSKITINGGTVTAIGAFRAAGIGAGKGGNNKGTITINGGTVTATGGKYGAGIGGGCEAQNAGYGGAGGTVIINGGTVTVTATGNDSDKYYPQAIGHGYGEDDEGSLTIAGNLCVKNDDGSTTYGSGERVSKCRDTGTRIIEECEHSEKKCTSNGDSGHTISCSYCSKTGSESHNFDTDGHTCKSCAYVMSDPKTVTIYMANSTGTGYGDATTESIQYGTAYTLPECTSVPSNMLFVGWKEITDAPSGIEADDSELTSLTAVDTEITVTENVTYYARYQSTIWPGGGEGTISDPYIISETSHWNTLASSIENKNVDFKGKYIRLDADIEVTTMVGTSSTRFRGNFDGNGHTLTVNYNTTDDVCAPFRFTYGATIENLKTTGSITTSKSNAGGVVGKNFTGSLTLKNVISDVTINSSKSGSAYHGGLVGYAINATIEGCAFTGKLLGGSSNTCGGLLGQKSNTNGSSVTIKNCLFLPTEVTVGTTNSCTFGAGTTDKVTVTNSFYSQTLGTAQGTLGYTVESVTEGLTLDYGGGNNYGTITAYTFDQGDDTTLGGLLYDGKLYTGGTTKVTFTPETSNGQEPTLAASNGETITNNGDGTYTLTMDNADVTITATSYSNYTVTLYDSGSTDAANTSHITNDETISDSHGRIADVTISGRTLYKDDKWNTLCLPFDVTLTGSPLADATLMELDTETEYIGHKTGLDGTTLYLYFKDATEIEVGKPYLIKWSSGSDFTPTFTSVTINSHSPKAVESEDGKVSFVGNFDPVTLAAGEGTYYLGTNNQLYYPHVDRTMNAFRAYFHVDGSVSAIQMSFGDDETTGIVSVTNTNRTNNTNIYDLQGRKIANGQKPTAKGLYIYKGKKVVIK